MGKGPGLAPYDQGQVDGGSQEVEEEHRQNCTLPAHELHEFWVAAAYNYA